MLTFIKKYKRAIIVLLVAALLLVAAFMSLAIYSARTLFESGKATPTAKQYSEWVGIWLPDDVQNFQSYGEGWQDWLIEARFDISDSEFTEFLERNRLQRSEVQGLLESSYKLEWFNAVEMLEQYEIKPSPVSASSTSAGFYLTVWIDDANPDRPVIYIKAFDT